VLKAARDASYMLRNEQRIESNELTRSTTTSKLAAAAGREQRHHHHLE
jgi:hypothetical protein